MRGLSKAIKNMDKTLFILTALLFIFGLLNIVSASSQTAVLKYNHDLYSYFFRQLIYQIKYFKQRMVAEFAS